MAVDDTTTLYASTPFEGPEKLLEVWFAPSADTVPGALSSKDGRAGLRKIPRHVWEDMLDIVKCKVLNVIEGDQTDAYLLRYIPDVLSLPFRSRAHLSLFSSPASRLCLSSHTG